MAFYNFLEDPQNNLRDWNEDDSTVFTALVSVLESNMVMVVYGLGIGPPCISQVSLIARKLLALFSEGGGMLGPVQLVLDTQVRSKAPTKSLTADEVYAVLQGGTHAVDKPIARALNVTNEVAIMRVAPILAYLVVRS